MIGTLVDLLRMRAFEMPDRRAYTFLSESGTGRCDLSYAELDRRARAIAGYLQSLGPMERPALLLYPTGVEFVAALFGCLYAGIMAIPAPLPVSRRDRPRAQKILADSQAAFGLTTAAAMVALEADAYITSSGEPCRWLASDVIDDAFADVWRDPGVRRDAVAYLQYTSGSTADPKGVMVTHSNVLHNAASIDEALVHTAESVSVSWLPHFHDMGLIYGLVEPLYGGFPAVLMPPMSFIQQPVRWLDAIAAFHATHSGGPNFAYDLCARNVTDEQRQGLDLRSWRVAFNGAERVCSETLARFAQAFEPCGFVASSFRPAYGLAEATLEVTCGTGDGAPLVCAFDAESLEHHTVVEVADARPIRRTLVGSGRASRDTQVVIVNPTSLTPSAPNEVGEIWVSSPSVAAGYWRQPEESARTFRAQLRGGPDVTFLRTGDLGFVHRDELFVAGRLKDLIIIRGHNHYPQDIELTAANADAELRPGGGAVFSVDSTDSERVVVVHEVKRTSRQPDVPAISAAIRRAVSEHHRLQVHAVALVKPGTVPKTSSGKVRRHACRQMFLSGSLPVIGTSVLDEPTDHDQPRRLARAQLAAYERHECEARVEAYLRTHVAGALGVSEPLIGVHEPLIALGCDSLIAAALSDRLACDLDVSVPAVDILRGLSVRQVTTQVVEALDAGVQSHEPTSDDGTRRSAAAEESVDVPWSFEQERLWFLNALDPGSPVYNIPAAIALEGALDVASLERSVSEIVRRHEPLRMNFRTEAARPVLRSAPPAPVSIPIVDLQELPDAERTQVATRLAQAETDHAFDLDLEPLIRFSLIRLGPETHWLIIVAHHIVFDAASLELFLRELQVLYVSSVSGVTSSLPDLTHTFGEFVATQRTAGAPLESDLRFWEARLREARRPLTLPSDRPCTPARSHRAAHVSFELSAGLSAGVPASSQRHHATPFMLLLSAFGATLAAWTGDQHVTIGSPTRGRPPHAANLIGLFAYPLPVTLELPSRATLAEIVADTRERLLETYTHQAVPFATLVRLAHPDRTTADVPLVHVMFSLLKDPTRAFAAPGLAVRNIDVRMSRCQFDLWLTLIEDASGAFRGVLTGNGDRFTDDTLHAFAASYLEVLDACVHRPETRLDQLPAGRTDPAIVVASSFTAEGLGAPIGFWMERSGFKLPTRFAPFGQTFQALLDRRSVLRENRGGVNVVALRLEDCCRLDVPSECPRVVDDLVSACCTAAAASAPCVVCLCPPSPTVLNRVDTATLVRAMEDELAAGLRDVPGICLVTDGEVQALYPVRDYYDAYSDEVARAPFTELYFTALGTLVARKIHALLARPYKVIVLDCDETLWLGACGDGAGEIRVDPARRFLQQFMVAQRDAGMLLCLCSKNNPEDVFEAFRRHPDMPLRPEHLVSFRVNWRSKSENLKALAGELQLATDSFIFIDDSTFECAEVRANCPDVLVLQLPESDRIERFLRQSWAFDHVTRTDADKGRSEQYAQDRDRARARESAASLDDFLASLELKVTFAEPTMAQWPRIAQLVQRTNQLNLTARRRSESEIRHLCDGGRLECLAVEVSDRFGDYGLVGAVLFEALRDALLIDTFVLSCRAMGRRVEHAMLGHLVDMACRRGCARVDLPFVDTQRNQPAREFLHTIATRARQPHHDHWIYTVPTSAHTSPGGLNRWAIKASNCSISSST